MSTLASPPDLVLTLKLLILYLYLLALRRRSSVSSQCGVVWCRLELQPESKLCCDAAHSNSSDWRLKVNVTGGGLAWP